MGHQQQQPSLLKKHKRFLVVVVVLIFVLFWLYRQTKVIEETLTKPFQQCKPGLIISPKQKEHLVPIIGTKTLLVSAYLEHRLKINKVNGESRETNIKQVRVIAVVLRSELVSYRCFLCCQDQLHITEGIRNIHSDHFGFAYGTADIFCPLPHSCKTVSHIVVTSAADKLEDNVKKQIVEVKNQEVKSHSFPYIFTVCISTMFDFNNVLQLIQSLEMLQLLGVNRVVIYKTNCSTKTQRVLEYYTRKGFVEVIPWSITKFVNVSRGWLPEHGPGDLHYFGQIPALNDCLYRYMYRSKYVAMHDIDELILPQSVDRWSDLLSLLDKSNAGGCYQFENNVFPNTVMLPKQNSCCPGWKNVPGVNILNHLAREPIIPEAHYENFKIIVNPRTVYEATVHGLLNAETKCVWVDRDIARLYHTRAAKQTHLTPNQLIYDDRLLSYSAHLKTAVDTVLKECGF